MTFALTVRRENQVQVAATFATLAEAVAAMDARRQTDPGAEPYVVQVRELLPHQAVKDGRIVADAVVLPTAFALLDRASAQLLADALAAAIPHLTGRIVDVEGGVVIEFHYGSGEPPPWTLDVLYGREFFLGEHERDRAFRRIAHGSTYTYGSGSSVHQISHGSECIRTDPGTDRGFRRVRCDGSVDPLVRHLKRQVNGIVKMYV